MGDKAMITGMSHMTFIVNNLDLATSFFVEIFGAVEIYASGDKLFSLSKEKFFMINDIWVCIMEGDSLQQRTYNHIAFKIDDNDYDRYLAKIKNMGLETKPERPRVKGEGRSIYFYDYDNHLFELHTGTLHDRLESYESI